MYLRRVSISNFKNIRQAQLEFSRKINCISGNNGEGKTNLLDAIYYLSMTKSYFNSSDSYTFTFGQDSTALNGIYVREDDTEDKISIAIRNGGDKTVKKNDKAYSRISAHIGTIPIVMVSPADTSLINGSGEERRKFINSILSQVDKEYLRRVMRYNQLLVQRNKLLKMPGVQGDFLDTINERMSPDAHYIYSKRLELCQSLQHLAKEFYSKLSADKEEISLQYISDIDDADDNSLNVLFARNLEKDLVLKYTSAGIHRDDVEFSLCGHPLRRCGSQGQQKSFLIALKLAQFVLMKQLHGFTPLLLLDDVFDKLDMQRVEYLLGLVASDDFGQIFITDSNKVRMSKIAQSVTKELQSFEVSQGVYQIAKP